MISVLYVDDEPALLEIGKHFLEQKGRFSVNTVTSAPEALLAISGREYDAIISDYQMPEMNGIEFLKKVRASGNTVPFIIFTGRGREEVVIEALNEGADFYLQKGGEPLSQFAELAHKLRKAVLQRRPEASVRDHERREADIINFLPDATFAIDNRGIVISWNLAMEKMTGILSEDILGKSDYEYAIPFYKERRPILIDLVLRDDPKTEAMYPYITRSGEKLFSEITISHMNDEKGVALWFTASPLYDTRGSIVGAIESIRDITARKEAERALNESEKRFRELSDLLPQAVYEAKTDGLLTYANRIAFEMFGYKQEDFEQGLNILGMIAPEDRGPAQDAIRGMIEGNSQAEPLREYQALRKDGSRFPISIYSSPVIVNGWITGLRGIIVDITDRKRAEQDIRESEEKYRTVFETTGAATVLIENDGTISLANSEFERLSGYRKDEVENQKKWMEFVVREDLDRMLAQHRLRRQDPQHALNHYEFRFIPRSGGFRDIYLTIDVIPGTTKSVASLLDITERKRAEVSLIAANREYTSLLRQIQDVYYRSDSEGRLIKASRSWATLLGYDDLSECLGLSIADDFYFDPADRKQFLEEVYRNGKVTDYEVHLKRKDGTRVDVATSSHLYRDPEGNILGVEGTFRDITERKHQDHILRTQLGLGIALQSIWELRETLETCLDAAIEASGMDAGGIYVVSETSGSIDLIVSKNLGNEFVQSASHYPPDSDNARILMAGNPVYVQYSKTGIVHNPVQGREGLKGSAIIPITYNNRVISCLNITSHTVDEIPVNARVALETIATQIGAAIQRIRADEALSESEQRYRNVVEDQTEFISRFLPDGTHVFVNEAYCRYFGLKRDEILMQRFRPKIPAEDQGRVKQFFESLTPGHPIGIIEHRIIMPDGGIRWQRWSDRAIFDRSGAMVEYQSVGRDFTDAKEAEIALQRSEARYRTLLNSVNEGIWVVGEDAITTYVNPIMAGMLGYTVDEMIGKDLFYFIDEKWRAVSIRKFFMRMEEVREQHEVKFIRKDGSYLTSLINTSPLYNTDGSFAGGIATVIDIGRRKETEEALRESEEWLRTIMQSVQTGIVIIDAATHIILDANPKALAMIGGEKKEVLGSVCHQFICPCEMGLCPISDLRQEIDSSERVLVTMKGTILPVLKTVIPATIGGKNVLVESVSDISELKNREERIRVLAGLLDLMPASVTIHDHEGRFLYANAKTFEYHGYIEDEFYKVNLHELDIPESEQLIAERIRQLEEDGEVSFEVRHFRKDRSVVPLLVNAKITTWEGRPVILSIASDISERKQMEEALIAREQDFAALADNSPDIIVRFDTELRHLYGNRTAERETGFTIEGTIGRRPGELPLPPPVAAVMEQSLGQVLRTGSENKVVLRFPTPRGPRSFETRIVPERGQDGTIVSLLAISRDITDRKQAEEKLQTSHQEYLSLLDQIQDVYYRSDTEGRLIRISRSMAEMLGYDTVTEILGKNIAEEFYANPSDRKKFLKEVSRAGKVSNYVVQLKKKDGTPVSISAHSHLWYNSDGTLGGVEGTFRDITEQKRVEEAIRESEEKYRLLFEQSNDAIFVADPQTRMLVDCNNRAEILTGYSRQEILAMRADQLHPEDVLAMTMEYFNKYALGMDTSVESVILTKDNIRVPVSINASRIDSTGKPLIIGIFRDITGQKQAESALKQRTDELDYRNRLISTLLDTVPIGIFMVEAPSGRPVIANREATRLLGQGIIPDTTGSNIGEVYNAYRLVISEPYPTKDMPIIRGMNGEVSHVDDMVVVRPGGSQVRLEVFGAPIIDSQGDTVASLVSFMDTTERKQAEQIIQETSKKINLLNSITRHDVANQVAVLKGYAQIALMKQPDPAVADFLSKIDEAGSTIARQIEFTKTYQELGMHAPCWSRVSETVSQIKPGEITISCTCDAEIFADPMLEKVFFNLIDNSIRHGERVTVIRIHCEEDPGGLSITVEDDGTGIPIDKKEKIFGKGYGKNTGFGLFLAREILAITGISIREAGKPGNGAMFVIAVPNGFYRLTSPG